MRQHLPLRVVERSSLEDETYRALREAIIAGRLEGRLVQGELAQSLGVSRITVRSALKRLESEHFVLIGARRGCYAKKIDVADLQEVVSLRLLLEPYATRIAVSRMGAQDIADLCELDRRMHDSASDAAAYVDLNLAFHRKLYRLSEMGRLVRMIESNWLAFPPIAPQTVPGQVERSLAEHSAILSSIEASEADQAALLMEQHLRNAGERLIAMVMDRGQAATASSKLVSAKDPRRIGPAHPVEPA